MVNREDLTEEELAERVQAILDTDTDESAKIRQLRDLGYSNTQINQEFGFKKSTVYKVCPVRPVKGGNDKSLETKGKPGYELMKIGSKDMIPPEQALRDIRLQDGDYKLGFVDGMGTLIMAARYNQILAASQAETLTNQLKIMEEARKGSAEVAQEAAARAAAGVGAQIMPEVQALKNQMLASSPNPMMSMFAQTMQPLLGQVMGNMMGMFQPRQPGQPQQGQAPTPQPAFQQPAGQEASEDEVKEAFG